MSSIQSVLITGANVGLGKETARQLAVKPHIDKIYLAARNPAKAAAAKADLERQTGRSIFEVVILDTTDLASIRSAVNALPALDAVVMNAGGVGGASPMDLTEDGVTTVFGVNVLGHAQLLQGLLALGKVRHTAVYVSSEAARGIPKMRISRPALASHSVDAFRSIADGTYFTKPDAMDVYAHVKYVGTLWMSSLARNNPGIRFVTVSPGGTTGTGAVDNAPRALGLFFKYIAMPLMSVVGMAHGLEVGAKRYVDVLLNARFESGHFYASPAGQSSGELVDQAGQFTDLDDADIQDAAAAAVQQLLTSPVSLAKSA